MAKLSSIRLSDYQRIENIIKTGPTFRASWGKLTWLPASHFTLTISISKKQFKLATDRNRVRRRLRNQVLKLQPLPTIDLLVLVYKSIDDFSLTEISNNLSDWQKT